MTETREKSLIGITIKVRNAAAKARRDLARAHGKCESWEDLLSKCQDIEEELEAALDEVAPKLKDLLKDVTVVWTPKELENRADQRSPADGKLAKLKLKLARTFGRRRIFEICPAGHGELRVFQISPLQLAHEEGAPRLPMGAFRVAEMLPEDFKEIEEEGR